MIAVLKKIEEGLKKGYHIDVLMKSQSDTYEVTLASPSHVECLSIRDSEVSLDEIRRALWKK